MPVPDGLGGTDGGGGLAPFDRHTADTALLAEIAAELTRLAEQAVDHNATTMQAFDPALLSWDGMAAPELRQAGSNVAERAIQASGAAAWGAVPLRYWAAKVTSFNVTVDGLRATRDGLAARDYGATGTNGDPPTASEIADARSAAMSPLYASWWSAYNTEILDGASTAATMYRDGPTEETLADARSVGAIPLASGPSAVFAALWCEQSMRDSAERAVDLARQILNSDNPPSQQDLERLHELLALHANDPAFAYFFLTTLGPENLLELTGDIALIQNVYVVDPQLAALVGGIQSGLGIALSVATQRTGVHTTSGSSTNGPYVRGRYELDSEWVSDLIAAGGRDFIIGYGPEQQAVYGFQLLGVLLNARVTPDYPGAPTVYADFDPHFLSRVGGAMLDFEIRRGGSHVWPGIDLGGYTNGLRLDWIGGHAEDTPAGFDPVTQLMFTLDRDPDAARRIFADYTVDDGERVSRVGYLLTDREWMVDVATVPPAGENRPPAGLVLLGGVLEGATADTGSPMAGRIVQQIAVSVGREGVVDPMLREPLANIAATWISDVHDSVGGDHPYLRGIDAVRFLGELARDPDARWTVYQAEAAHAAVAYDEALADGNVDGLVAVSGRAGYVLGTLDAAFLAERHGEVSAEREGNRVVNNGIDAVKSAGLAYLNTVVPHSGTAVGVTGVPDDLADGVKDLFREDRTAEFNYEVGEMREGGRSTLQGVLEAAIERSDAVVSDGEDEDQTWIALDSYNNGFNAARDDLDLAGQGG